MTDMYYGRDTIDDKQKVTKPVHYDMFAKEKNRELQKCLHKIEQATEKITKSLHKELETVLCEVRTIKAKYEWITKEFARDEIKETAKRFRKCKDE